MQHTLSILLQNEPGALLHVTGVFSARNINVDALTVAATHEPGVSQLIVVLSGQPQMLDPVLRQLRKLVAVLDAGSLALDGHRDPPRLAARSA